MQIHGPALRFGIHSGQQYASFQECLGLWQRGEALGYDWISLFDHARPPLGGPDGPCLEGPTLLAALAARTSTIRCALLVSTLTWRHPAQAAAIAATIDHISGGRLEFGIGAGGPDLGYRQYGIPFPNRTERLEMLTEGCHILRSLWTRERTDFTGRHYRLQGACLQPKPLQRRLPLVIGGADPRHTLRIVAEHADIWNALAGTLESYRHRCAALAEHCAAVGRNPADIRKSITFRALLAEDSRALHDRRQAWERRHPPTSPDRREFLVLGTPEQCVERLLPYLRLGVGDFLLGARPPVDWHTVELFARQVVPALRGYAGL
ncbi:LLM class flavin-dependent oxidoreductase [Streptomyces gilvosporeus]|uniref:Luciferase n=1 Tax=Streptomyces gilvosporeus TaxID=553510 RepID=A0A1V0TJZ5_9ACTN|nr:LLM class flavin-dependent oxidoreductase [Streptomyces gilvosporeus]ARF53267.1 luciferase [Streptomyces gilvosporeus]